MELGRECKDKQLCGRDLAVVHWELSFMYNEQDISQIDLITCSHIFCGCVEQWKRNEQVMRSHFNYIEKKTSKPTTKNHSRYIIYGDVPVGFIYIMFEWHLAWISTPRWEKNIRGLDNNDLDLVWTMIDDI